MDLLAFPWLGEPEPCLAAMETVQDTRPDLIMHSPFDTGKLPLQGQSRGRRHPRPAGETELNTRVRAEQGLYLRT